MPVTFVFALALAAAGPSSAAPEGGATSDAQIIVVEVPDPVRATPTGGPVVTPTPPAPQEPSPSAVPDHRGALPATGWDATALAAAAAFGTGALATGILMSRRHRRRT